MSEPAQLIEKCGNLGCSE